MAIHSLLCGLIIIRYYREDGGELAETFGGGNLLDEGAGVVAAYAHHYGYAAGHAVEDMFLKFLFLFFAQGGCLGRCAERNYIIGSRLDEIVDVEVERVIVD